MYLSDIMSLYRLAINWLLFLSFLNVSILWRFFDSLWQLDAYIFTDLGNLVWIWRDYCDIGIKDCVFRPQKTTETIFVLHLEAWLLPEKKISSENRKTEKKRNVRGRKARRSESDSFYQKLQQWVFDLLPVWTVTGMLLKSNQLSKKGIQVQLCFILKAQFPFSVY